MINSKKIEDLHPKLQTMAYAWLAACKKAGIEVLITSTYRDKQYQDWLFAQGRTRPGKVVTYARGGQSMHNFRLAFDFVVLHDGKADWGDLKTFQRARKIGETVGLKGLSFELAHLQWTGGLSLAQLQSGKVPS
jgi:peptidoglycan LD-endopeptidase CwlK